MSYYVVTDPPFNETQVVSFESLDSIVMYLKELRSIDKKELIRRKVLIFEGTRVFLSSSEPKYLIQPGGEPVLIDDKSDISPDFDGFLLPPFADA